MVTLEAARSPHAGWCMREVFCFESVLRSGAAAILTRVHDHGSDSTSLHGVAKPATSWRAPRLCAAVRQLAGITKNHMW
jgi:hypothetical protein